MAQTQTMSALLDRLRSAPAAPVGGVRTKLASAPDYSGLINEMAACAAALNAGTDDMVYAPRTKIALADTSALQDRARGVLDRLVQSREDAAAPMSLSDRLIATTNSLRAHAPQASEPVVEPRYATSFAGQPVEEPDVAPTASLSSLLDSAMARSVVDSSNEDESASYQADDEPSQQAMTDTAAGNGLANSVGTAPPTVRDRLARFNRRAS